jgi:hypothetical protein
MKKPRGIFDYDEMTKDVWRNFFHYDVNNCENFTPGGFILGAIAATTAMLMGKILGR